ncbi:hypothetical protein PMAYCL1PPCAC_10064, partial [Pristionchus mayeri]
IFEKDSERLMHYASAHTDHHMFKCTHCPVFFLNEDDLKAHVPVHGQKATVEGPTCIRAYLCDACSKVFSTARCLYRHVYNSHAVRDKLCTM